MFSIDDAVNNKNQQKKKQKLKSFYFELRNN